MGFALDSILKQDLAGDVTTYETITVDGASEIAEAHRAENGFIIQIDYNNGSAANISFSVEASIDGVSFVAIPNTTEVVTDTDGTIINDISNTSANYVRVAWDVTAGSVDIHVQYSAKRRH